MSKAYKLKRNVDHVKANEDYDVWHAFKDRKEKFDEKFLRLEPFDEVPPHRFIGKIEQRLSWLDFPREKFGYPIVSKKMVKTLLSVGSFDHEVKPLTIYDWKSQDKTTDDFVFLHLLEWKDIIDRKNCTCYSETRRIRKLALKEPRGGYPPLFRVKDAGLKWFVSEEAKSALEAADIKGVRFVPLIYPESETTSEPEPIENTEESSQSLSTEELLSFKPVFPPRPNHIIAPGIEGLFSEYFGQSYNELYQKYNSYRIIPLVVASYKERVDPVVVKLSISEIDSLIGKGHEEKYLRDRIFPKYGIKVEMSRLGVSYIGFLERVHEELVGKKLYY